MTTLPAVIHRADAIPVKIPKAFKKKNRNRKTHPKVYMESQGTPNSQNNLGKEEQSLKDSHFLISKLIIKL